jgi:hypothetical protein
MSLEDAQNLRLSKPERRPVLESETLIRGRRTKTNERFRVRISRSLAEQLRGLGSPAFPGAESMWRERVKKLFRDAGVIMTPHGFRHFRISEWLAQGFQPSDVSKWVGASEKEIRKTYEHWIQEAEDRLDTLQRQSSFLRVVIEMWNYLGESVCDLRNRGLGENSRRELIRHHRRTEVRHPECWC